MSQNPDANGEGRLVEGEEGDVLEAADFCWGKHANNEITRTVSQSGFKGSGLKELLSRAMLAAWGTPRRGRQRYVENLTKSLCCEANGCGVFRALAFARPVLSERDARVW